MPKSPTANAAVHQQHLAADATEHGAVIERALAIMESRLQSRDVALTSPQAVRDYLRLKIADREHEVFVVLFLDSQNRLIATEEMFRGNPRANLGLPEGGGEGCAEAQRGGDDLRPQPPVRFGGTE